MTSLPCKINVITTSSIIIIWEHTWQSLHCNLADFFTLSSSFSSIRLSCANLLSHSFFSSKSLWYVWISSNICANSVNCSSVPDLYISKQTAHTSTCKHSLDKHTFLKIWHHLPYICSVAGTADPCNLSPSDGWSCLLYWTACSDCQRLLTTAVAFLGALYIPLHIRQGRFSSPSEILAFLATNKQVFSGK